MIKTKELQNIIKIGDNVKFDFGKISWKLHNRIGVWIFDGYKYCNVNCSICEWCKGRMKFHQNEKSFIECLVYIIPGSERVSPVVLEKLDFYLENDLFEI